MTGPELARDSETSGGASIVESNFDKLQKTYPDHKDQIQFIKTHEKIQDNPEAQEALSNTIYTLAQENILDNMDDFWKNIETVTNNLLQEDRIVDNIAVLEQTGNDFVFRTAFERLEKENIKNQIKNDNLSKGNIAEDISNVVEDKSEVAEDISNVIENKNQITNEKIEKINTGFKNLETKYAGINNTYKPKTPADIENIRINNPNIQKTLDEADISSDNQTLYFSYLYATEQIIAEANKPENNKKISQENYAFVKDFITLNDNLGIKNTININDFDIEREENNEQKKQKESERSIEDMTHNENLGEELVEFNADIEDYVGDKEIKAIETEEIQNNPDIQDVVGEKCMSWYEKDVQKAVDELLNKNNLKKYKDNFDETGNIIDAKDMLVSDISPEDLDKLNQIKERVNTYFSEIATTKISEDTNKVIKKKTVAALLQNIGQYFEIDNAAETFNIDLESGIEFNFDTTENTMKLSGNMEGEDITFYYHMNTGKVEMEHDAIYYNSNDKTFYTGGDIKNGREELMMPDMPTLEATREEAKTAMIKKIPDVLKNTDHLEEYEQNLSQESFSLNTRSETTDIVIEHAMAKNLALKDTQAFLENYTADTGAYNINSERELYNLYEMIHTSFNRYSADELNTWRNTLATFSEKIDPEGKQNFKDGMLKNLFSSENIDNDIDEEYVSSEGPSIYRFFDAITYDQAGTTKDQVINLHTFSTITNEISKPEGTTENISGQSPKYRNLREEFNKLALDDQMTNAPERGETPNPTP